MKARRSTTRDTLPFFLGVSQGWVKTLVYRVYLDQDELLFLAVAPYNVFVDVKAAGRADGSHWSATAASSIKAWAAGSGVVVLSAMGILGWAIARASFQEPGNAFQLILFLLGAAGVAIPMLLMLALWSIRSIVVRAQRLDKLTDEQIREEARKGGDNHVVEPEGLSKAHFKAPGGAGGLVKPVAELTFEHDPSGKWKLWLMTPKDVDDAIESFRALMGKKVKIDPSLR